MAAKLAEQLLAAQSPWGRTRLRWRAAWKGVAWRLTTGGARAVKRAIDLVASSALIALLSPLLATVALLVRRDGGPAFFAQTRIGYRGREFAMLKFRSMCVDAEAKLAELLEKNEKRDGITFKMRDDPRVTPVGRFIRKTSIDELPQLFNVWRGDMSLVGPRPPLPREVELYSTDDRRRLLAKPGITCLWQIGEREGGLFELGDRNAIGFEEQVSLDVKYIGSQSLFTDIWILMKTVPAVLLGRGAA